MSIQDLQKATSTVEKYISKISDGGYVPLFASSLGTIIGAPVGFFLAGPVGVIGGATVGFIAGGSFIWLVNCSRGNSLIAKLFVEDPNKNDLKRGSSPSLSILYLQEEYEVVTFHGRKDELHKLGNDGWMKEELPSSKNVNVSVFLITGGPGAGKSRLARQLCECAKKWKWNGKPWKTGFLEEGPPEQEKAFGLLMARQEPLLLVIDAAERRGEQVWELVKTAFESERRDRYPVRVVLIARSEGGEGGWWSALGTSFKNGRRFKGLDNPFDSNSEWKEYLRPIEMDLDGKDKLFKCAAKDFWKELKGSSDDMPGDLLKTPRNLLRAEEVLDIHIEALLAVYGATRSGAMLQTNSYEEELFQDLFDCEQQSWGPVLKIHKLEGLKPEDLQLAFAWLGTTDGLGGKKSDNDPALTRLSLLPEFQGGDGEAVLRRKRIAAAAQELYPGPGNKWWGGIRPDRFATWLASKVADKVNDTQEPEALVADLPADALCNLLRHFTWRFARYQRDDDKEALRKAIRAGGKRAFVATVELGAESSGNLLIGMVAAEVLEEGLKKAKDKGIDIAREVYKRIFHDGSIIVPGFLPYALLKLAFVATEILIEEGDLNEEQYVDRVSALCSCLFLLNHTDKAYEKAKQAESLVKSGPTSKPNQVIILNTLLTCSVNLFVQSGEDKHLKEAGEYARNVKKICRDLVNSPSEENDHPLLTMTSVGLGHYLMTRGGVEERSGRNADKLFRVALKLLEKAEIGSGPSKLVRAQSLNLQAICLWALKDYQEGPRVNEKAEKDWRDLVESHHEFNRSLAEVLHRKGLFFLRKRKGTNKDKESAAASFKEAIECQKKFYLDRPEEVYKDRDMQRYFTAYRIVLREIFPDDPNFLEDHWDFPDLDLGTMFDEMDKTEWDTT